MVGRHRHRRDHRRRRRSHRCRQLRYYVGIKGGYEASLVDVFRQSLIAGAITVAILRARPVLGVLVGSPTTPEANGTSKPWRWRRLGEDQIISPIYRALVAGPLGGGSFHIPLDASRRSIRSGLSLPRFERRDIAI